MTRKQELEKELEKVPELVAAARFQGFVEGIQNESNKWVNALLPESVEITIRVRDKYENTEATRKVITFEDIKQSNLKSLRYAAEDAVIEIATREKNNKRNSRNFPLLTGRQ